MFAEYTAERQFGTTQKHQCVEHSIVRHEAVRHAHAVRCDAFACVNDNRLSFLELPPVRYRKNIQTVAAGQVLYKHDIVQNFFFHVVYLPSKKYLFGDFPGDAPGGYGVVFCRELYPDEFSAGSEGGYAG